MMAAMALFVTNDVFAKLASETLQLGQILVVRNAFICVVVVAVALATGLHRKTGTLLTPAVGWRAVGEAVSTPLYLLALFNLPIANVTAILQILPLLLTAIAAIYFREAVGPRRWAAAAIGFGGVLLIVQPGMAGFSPWSLSALGATLFIALRDTATRRIDKAVPTLLIAGSTAVVIFALGACLLPFQEWRPMDGRTVAYLLASGTCLLLAYMCITVAMRTGELSLVGLFRYSIVLWAMLLGYAVWRETPDGLAVLGTGLVIAAGIYTVLRERAKGTPR